MTVFPLSIRCGSALALTVLVGLLETRRVEANPTGGTVSQGSASISSAGSQLTISQTSANAYINWGSFNIGAGETTTFNQPTATSVAWNQINDASPSQILGNLNANGYVILQNQNGFSIGGAAVLNAHGLVMTTSPMPAPSLSSGGAWTFNAPPPAAKIVNYGTINIAGGGSAFLIANDIENNGTISAPGGKVGLYAGEKVVVSTSPDGRGLSTSVALPQGSVDNQGHLVPNAGIIVANALINQNGLIQANSALNDNGTIELVAGDSINLGANSQINANGNSTLTSTLTEGAVALNAGNTITVGNSAGIAANGGKISLEASTINQNGTLQANSIKYANGTIELHASEAVNLGVGSQINANGDPTITSPSPRGAVTLNADHNALTVAAGVAISANGGTISLNAPIINQDGTLQANAIQNISGTIDLNATAAVNLGANSVISANGDTAGTSSGGSVNIQSSAVFSDRSGSVINVGGGTLGGNAGQVTISAPQMSLVETIMNGHAAAEYADARLNLDTANITVNGDGSAVAGQLALNANSLSAGFSQVNLQATGNLEVSSLWHVIPKSGLLDTVSLLAGDTLTVDAGGGIQADGGKLVLNANTVNQNGRLQANSINNANGVIEIDAGGTLALGASSQINANGDSTYASGSAGGFVVLDAGIHTFTDAAGSTISVSGAKGGPDGVVEIFGNNLLDITSVHSTIGNNFATLINPYDITLSYDSTAISSSPNFNITDLAGYSQQDMRRLGYSQIDLHALDNIELSAEWFLNDPGSAAALMLLAGNSLILDDAAGINAENNWSVNLMAGTGFVPTVGHPKPASGTDGIYLNGSSYVQTVNGDINLWAANEVLVATAGNDLDGSSGIRTLGGGDITVNAQYGNVNSGNNSFGFNYQASAPYYTVATDYGASLGGISTAAGGNVSINAGGNVYSYVPSGSTPTAAADAGTGAFGSQPGNVTINAQGSVYGHYVLANGVGSIISGKNIGAPIGNPFALSLITGTWSINAPAGNIYLQEVRNPNGVFNDVRPSSPGYQRFNYSPQAAVSLTAGKGVYLTGLGVPRPAGNVPILYPSILDITAGSDGVTLDANVTLFPSFYQDLIITTTGGGNLAAPVSLISPYELYMSDSAQTQWKNSSAFSDQDHGSTPFGLNNPNPVLIDISGSMENLNLITAQATELTVAGDIINSGFAGQNLQANDGTSIRVAGQIYDQSAYAFVTLSQAIPSLSASDLPPGTASSWDDIFTAALNSATIATLPVPNLPVAQWAGYVLRSASLFPYATEQGQLVGLNPGFVYNPATGQLGFGGPMAQSVLSALSQPTLTVLRFGVDGLPVTYTGADGKTYFATDQVNWVNPAVIATLFAASQPDPSPSQPQLGFRVGGPGQFDVTAGSISLGNSYGILSCGVADPQGGYNRYGNLAAETPAGATLNVTVAEDSSSTVNGVTTITPSLDILTSTIAAIGGGDVNVNSTGGSMDLGSEALFNTSRQVGFGIFTSGHGDVNVTALGDINIDGSRIATYNGGNIFVESLQGNVNVGSGGATFNGVGVSYVNPATTRAGFYAEDVYGSGIVANTLVTPPAGVLLPPGSASVPGNITVETPQGDITASLGGILQEALNGNISAGPTVNLIAGTPPSGTPGAPGYSAGHTGNIDLGTSGVIGGTVNITANGNVKGLIISRQNSTIDAAQNFDGTVLSGGQADVSGGVGVTGLIVGVNGANVSGGNVTAQILGQNVSVNGGAAQSTLGTTAAATSTSQSAANQSNNDAKQQLASNDDSSDDDKKKKKPKLQHLKRVTVILPKTG
jgi:filamentous hemagglutinin family protein